MDRATCWTSVVATVLACASLIACGGGGGESPTVPVAVVQSTPAPAPTPAATPAPPAGYPPYPELLSPVEGAVLNTYPRVMTLEWAPVVDSVGVRYYRVELELGYSTPADGWTPIPDRSGYYGDCAGLLTVTSCTTFSFPGAQLGRWRVIVANRDGRETASVWRTFRFAR